MKHFNLVSKPVTSQGASSKSTGGGNTTIINNIVNNTSVETPESVYKGRITRDDLMALTEDQIGDNDLYLCYASYTPETAWSFGSRYFLNPDFTVSSSSSGVSIVKILNLVQGEHYRFSVSDTTGSVQLTITPCNLLGTQTHSPIVDTITSGGNISVSPTYNDQFVKVECSGTATISAYTAVNDGSFVQYIETVDYDAANHPIYEKKWRPVSLPSSTGVPRFSPLQHEISLITNMRPTGTSSDLYNEQKPGVYLCDVATYTLNGNLYTQNTYTYGTAGQPYAGSVDTRILTVPYAHYYMDGSERVFTHGALSAEDYSRLWNRTEALTVAEVQAGTGTEPKTISAANLHSLIQAGGGGTAYSAMTQEEIDAGTSTVAEVVSPKLLADNIYKTGSLNATATKLFLIGATLQATKSVAKSNVNCYIGTDNCLYSNGQKVLTSHQSLSGYARLSDIPTNVSSFNNDAGYTTNIGTITTVQKNGTTIASSGVANITVPTKVSDLTDESYWDALTQETTGTSNCYRVIATISHTPSQYHDWAATIELFGNSPSEFGGNVSFRMQAQDASSSQIATPDIYFIHRGESNDDTQLPYVRIYRRDATHLDIAVYKASVYTITRARLVNSFGTTITKVTNGGTYTNDPFIAEAARTYIATRYWTQQQGYLTEHQSLSSCAPKLHKHVFTAKLDGEGHVTILGVTGLSATHQYNAATHTQVVKFNTDITADWTLASVVSYHQGVDPNRWGASNYQVHTSSGITRVSFNITSLGTTSGSATSQGIPIQVYANPSALAAASGYELVFVSTSMSNYIY